MSTSQLEHNVLGRRSPSSCNYGKQFPVSGLQQPPLPFHRKGFTDQRAKCED